MRMKKNVDQEDQDYKEEYCNEYALPKSSFDWNSFSHIVELVFLVNQQYATEKLCSAREGWRWEILCSSRKGPVCVVLQTLCNIPSSRTRKIRLELSESRLSCK